MILNCDKFIRVLNKKEYDTMVYYRFEYTMCNTDNDLFIHTYDSAKDSCIYNMWVSDYDT